MTTTTLPPLTIGIVGLTAHASLSVRSQARIALSAWAHREGYAVLEVFEIDGQAVKDDAAYAAVQAMAEGGSAKAVMTAGPLDRHRVAQIAADTHLIMLTKEGDPRP